MYSVALNPVCCCHISPTCTPPPLPPSRPVLPQPNKNKETLCVLIVQCSLLFAHSGFARPGRALPAASWSQTIKWSFLDSQLNFVKDTGSTSGHTKINSLLISSIYIIALSSIVPSTVVFFYLCQYKSNCSVQLLLEYQFFLSHE